VHGLVDQPGYLSIGSSPQGGDVALGCFKGLGLRGIIVPRVASRRLGLGHRGTVGDGRVKLTSPLLASRAEELGIGPGDGNHFVGFVFEVGKDRSDVGDLLRSIVAAALSLALRRGAGRTGRPDSLQ
jgi:hypothetical protein